MAAALIGAAGVVAKAEAGTVMEAALASQSVRVRVAVAVAAVRAAVEVELEEEAGEAAAERAVAVTAAVRADVAAAGLASARGRVPAVGLGAEAAVGRWICVRIAAARGC